VVTGSGQLSPQGKRDGRMLKAPHSLALAVGPERRVQRPGALPYPTKDGSYE